MVATSSLEDSSMQASDFSRRTLSQHQKLAPGSKTLATVALSVLLTLCIPSADARTYHYTDSHLHFVDFLQHSQGTAELLREMDNAGIDYAMLSGLPVTKKWDEHAPKKPLYMMADDARLYWYSATDDIVGRALEALPKKQQQRFYPFISGFNPSDRNAVDHIERMLNWYPGLWKGIGEVLLRHDDLTALTYGETPRANSLAMQRVYDLAAKHHLPVLLHSNITANYEKTPIYLGELEAALAHNRSTKIIWAHAGTSDAINRQQYLPYLAGTLDQLLAKNTNLYIDLSWTVLHPYLLDSNNKPRAEWVKLVKKYPSRFFIGSDLIGYFTSQGQTLQSYSPFLDALPDGVAKGLARDNFLKLFQ
ncbi:amidohydrolase family protein [Pokkaliibacter sp. CJK22405]|uniref:amidohydrolase family protein n=1 Tax=Pokkaliibacter sp. CJK22405 TaxID=3384615 RepID=UPI0039847352